MPSTARKSLTQVWTSEINQYFAALTNMRSVGVMGDERTYDYAIALRAVKTFPLTAQRAHRSLCSVVEEEVQNYNGRNHEK